MKESEAPTSVEAYIKCHHHYIVKMATSSPYRLSSSWTWHHMDLLELRTSSQNIFKRGLNMNFEDGERIHLD